MAGLRDLVGRPLAPAPLRPPGARPGRRAPSEHLSHFAEGVTIAGSGTLATQHDAGASLQPLTQETP